jgi:hypothetical protein
MQDFDRQKVQPHQEAVIAVAERHVHQLAKRID